MGSEFGESTSIPPRSESNNNNDAGDFECNICFDLAQNPIVTLCGHLFCWPCLYKWLHIHSHSHECPVCKALVIELNGSQFTKRIFRVQIPSPNRSRSIPGINIPNRPAGQRPETAPPPDPHHFPQNAFGFIGGLGGFGSNVTTRFGNFTFSAAFGGLIPSLFNFQVHGIPDGSMYGAPGVSYGFPYSFHGGHAHGSHHQRNPGQQADSSLKMLFLMIGFFVILALLWN